MSIALMTLAWKTDLPSGRKMVLLALCDHANDHGECYPSVEALSRKCSMGQRTVQQHLGELEAAGILVRRFRSGRSTVYQLDPRTLGTPAIPAAVRNPHPVSAIPAPQPPQLPGATPASCAPITLSEPSKDPSRKRQMARGTRLAPTWELPGTWADWARQLHPSWTAEHVRLVADKFRDHWVALPGQRGVKADWLATWRNWCRNELLPGDDKSESRARWWMDDATTLAKGTELGLTPLPGESAVTFKSRIHRALDNVGNPMSKLSLPETVAPPEGAAKVTISLANRIAALDAARSLKRRHANQGVPKP